MRKSGKAILAPVRLTNHIAIDGYPAYSPDGKKIAFISNRDGLHAIYVMNADGGDVRKLVNGLPNCSWPAWSSDGTKLYFYAEDGWYVMNADGGNPIKITYPFGRLSPDGKKIVFVDGSVPGSKETHEIFVGDVGGGLPTWSPDGKKIAFVASKRDGNSEIYVMDVAGK